MSTSDLMRGDELDVHVETVSEMRCRRARFVVTDEQHVFEHGDEVFSRTRETRIPRDLV